MSSIYAFTAGRLIYPEYISVDAVMDGAVQIIVRSAPGYEDPTHPVEATKCGPTASILLTREQRRALGNALLATCPPAAEHPCAAGDSNG